MAIFHIAASVFRALVLQYAPAHCHSSLGHMSRTVTVNVISNTCAFPACMTAVKKTHRYTLVGISRSDGGHVPWTDMLFPNAGVFELLWLIWRIEHGCLEPLILALFGLYLTIFEKMLHIIKANMILTLLHF